jgi:hypothetical protein
MPGAVGCGLGGAGVLEAVPPHPLITDMPITLKAISRICLPRRLFRPRKQSEPTNARSGNNGADFASGAASAADALAGSAVSTNVAVCCSVPDEAVTVTVDVTGCGFPVGGVVDCVTPPQLVSRNSPNRPDASSSNCTLSLFFRPKKQRTAASAEHGNHRPGLLPRAVDALVVLTVSVARYRLPHSL